MCVQFILKYPKILLIIFTTTILHPIKAVPYPKTNQSTQIATSSSNKLIQGRILNSDLIQDLEKYVSEIPIRFFDGSALLIQYLDYLNRIVTFRHLDKERQPYSIYDVRLVNGVTKRKDTFVLKEGQDLIKVLAKKRQFVGLRRAGLEDRGLFFVFYIYLKDARPNDKNKKIFGGKPYTIEMDFWDHRGGQEYRSQLFGWSTCGDSIFVPCKSLQEDSKKLAPIALIKSAKKLAPKSKTKARKTTNLTFKISETGSDLNSEIDYFYDLDPTPSSASYIRKKIDLLTRKANSKSNRGIQGRSIKSKKAKNNNKTKPTKSTKPAKQIVIKQDGRGLLGMIKGLAGKIVNQVGGVVTSVVRWGIGLTKSFAGLAVGGLGTVQATIEDVMQNTMDEGVLQPGWLDDKEMAALLAEIQEPTAGGLGGMINPDESPDERNVTTKEFEETSVYKISDGLQAFFDKTGRSFKKSGDDNNDKEFPDPMPKALVDRIVDASLTIEVDTFIHPGWKTLWKSRLANRVTLDHENEPFIGFGPCPYTKVTYESLKAASSPFETISIFMSALGTKCIKVAETRLLSLLREGYLIIQPDNSFVVRGDLKDLTESLIPISSIRKLSQAVEFAAFNKIFKKQLKNLTPNPKSPNGNPISRSIFTLGLIIQEELELIQKITQSHSIRLRRNIVKTLQTVFTKLIQDDIILGDCWKCEADKKINYNDRLYVLGLCQFIFRGLGPTLYKGIEVETALEEFLKKNKAVIVAKLKWFD